MGWKNLPSNMVILTEAIDFAERGILGVALKLILHLVANLIKLVYLVRIKNHTWDSNKLYKFNVMTTNISFTQKSELVSPFSSDFGRKTVALCFKVGRYERLSFVKGQSLTTCVLCPNCPSTPSLKTKHRQSSNTPRMK